MNLPGIFITLEGGEGAGKSTLSRRLADGLAHVGRDIVLTREPGGSPRAEALRSAILGGAAKEYGPAAEAMLFYAARDDHLKHRIRPALARGAIVICDRFSDSTQAYQGAAGRMSAQLLVALDRLVVGANRPDLTLVLDLPPEIGLKRAASRMVAGDVPDRFEAEKIGFHHRLRRAFLDIAAANPDRCIVIDASGDPGSIAAMAEEAIRSRLGDRLMTPAAAFADPPLESEALS